MTPVEREEQRRRWPVPSRRVSWLLLALGVLASLIVGTVTRATLVDRSNAVVQDTAETVTENTRVALERDIDLARAAQAHLALTFADDGARSLQDWFSAMDVPERFPEMVGVGFIERVAADDLAQFALESRGVVIEPGEDPVARLGIVPGGARPTYCVAAAGVTTDAVFGEAMAFTDLCAGATTTADGGIVDVAAELAEAERTRSPMSRAMTVRGVPYLAFFMPVSAPSAVGAPGGPGAQPAWGWMVGTVDVGAVLAAALPANTEVSARLSRIVDGTTETVAVVGTVDPDDSDTVERIATFDLGGPWELHVDVQPPTSALAANGYGALALLSALITTLLVFFLVRVLATSKDRAWELVRIRTAELAHQALHDPLTGLPNRALVSDRAEHLLARARRTGATPAALFIDLDGFKAVNDTFGHQTGDGVLVAAADRLRRTVRQAETVGRLGGDEFVVLLDQTDDGRQVTTVAQRIVDAFTEPFELPGASSGAVSVGASIGVALGVRDSAEDLLRDADTALYEAKADGKGRYVVFQAAMHDVLQERVHLEVELRAALKDDRLDLRYIPWFDLDTGRVIAAQAHLDLAAAGLGSSCAEVRDLLGDSAVVSALGRWSLQRACRDAAGWRRELGDLVVAIEVPPRQFASPTFADEVITALEDAGLPASGLLLELDESLLLSAPGSAARARVDRLRRAGVGVAVGDFARRYLAVEGAGLPADVLKVPAELVEGVDRSDRSASVVRAIVELGHGLGMRVIAEGPDRRSIRDALRRERCDAVHTAPSGDGVRADAVAGLVRAAVDGAKGV